jgi:hypothetical protein
MVSISVVVLIVLSGYGRQPSQTLNVAELFLDYPVIFMDSVSSGEQLLIMILSH